MAQKGEETGEGIVRRYSVLCALTPLVPLPIVDNLAEAYFRRRMLRSLARRQGAVLPSADTDALVDAAWGCGPGCVIAIVVYPLKKLFRTIFYFLEMKRAVDTGSAAYHFGMLFDQALARGWWTPGSAAEAARLRAAIDAAVRRGGSSPIAAAFRKTFAGSKATLRAAARALRDRLPGRRPQASDVEAATLTIEDEQEAAVSDVAGRLAEALGKVPPGYMEGLYRMLQEELSRSPDSEVKP